MSPSSRRAAPSGRERPPSQASTDFGVTPMQAEKIVLFLLGISIR